jgi:Zn-dependent alcohol dehydrogenase
MRSRRLNFAKSAGLCAMLALGAAAFAASPIPSEKVAVAKASVQRAEQAGAAELAAVEMAAAREKLARAERAIADHNKLSATQLAEQADVDAQLAEATALRQKSHKAAMEFDASMQALRQESQRNTSSN